MLAAFNGPFAFGGSSMNDTMTASQAARRLGLSPQRIRQLMAAGKLAFVGTPLGRLIYRADVERLAAERTAASEQANG